MAAGNSIFYNGSEKSWFFTILAHFSFCFKLIRINYFDVKRSIVKDFNKLRMCCFSAMRA